MRRRGRRRAWSAPASRSTSSARAAVGERRRDRRAQRPGRRPQRHVAARPGPRDDVRADRRRAARASSLDDVVLRFGDSGVVPRGIGTFGSRSIAMGGSALVLALDKIVAKVRAVAAHLLGGDGRGRRLGRRRAARRRRARWRSGRWPPRRTAPAAAAGHGARAERERALQLGRSCSPRARTPRWSRSSGRPGGCRVLRMAAVDDAGTLINPLLAHGQVVGGIAQTLGQCLTEEVVHDELGQLQSASLLDYSLHHRGRDAAAADRRRPDAVAAEPARRQGRRRGRRRPARCRRSPTRSPTRSAAAMSSRRSPRTSSGARCARGRREADTRGAARRAARGAWPALAAGGVGRPAAARASARASYAGTRDRASTSTRTSASVGVPRQARGASAAGAASTAALELRPSDAGGGVEIEGDVTLERRARAPGRPTALLDELSAAARAAPPAEVPEPEEPSRPRDGRCSTRSCPRRPATGPLAAAARRDARRSPSRVGAAVGLAGSAAGGGGR